MITLIPGDVLKLTPDPKDHPYSFAVHLDPKTFRFVPRIETCTYIARIKNTRSQCVVGLNENCYFYKLLTNLGIVYVRQGCVIITVIAGKGF